MRRVAAHEVRCPDGSTVHPGIVEIADGTVRKIGQFVEELERTEWLGGTIEIRQEGESLRAYKNNKPI